MAGPGELDPKKCFSWCRETYTFSRSPRSVRLKDLRNRGSGPAAEWRSNPEGSGYVPGPGADASCSAMSRSSTWGRGNMRPVVEAEKSLWNPVPNSWLYLYTGPGLDARLNWWLACLALPGEARRPRQSRGGPPGVDRPSASATHLRYRRSACSGSVRGKL